MAAAQLESPWQPHQQTVRGHYLKHFSKLSSTPLAHKVTEHECVFVGGLLYFSADIHTLLRLAAQSITTCRRRWKGTRAQFWGTLTWLFLFSATFLLHCPSWFYIHEMYLIALVTRYRLEYQSNVPLWMGIASKYTTLNRDALEKSRSLYKYKCTIYLEYFSMGNWNKREPYLYCFC